MSGTNILLITSDQQHWNTLGAFNPEVATPNLDRLVEQGTTFDRAYCPNPTCTPTRSSIITGMYPSQHGAWTLGTKLPEDVPTLGGHLSRAGYRTALVGKAHFQQLVDTTEFPSAESYPKLQDLAFWNDFHGPYYGFDHIELARNHTGEAHVGQHYALWMEEQGCVDWRQYFWPPTGTLDRGAAHTWAIPEELHTNAWIAERVTALIEQYSDAQSPFFCWASFLDPHPPYLVPAPWDTMYDPDALTLPSALAGEHDRNAPHFALTQNADPDFSAWRETGHTIHGFKSHLVPEDERRRSLATYYGMVSLLDKYVGVILDRLDGLGLAENTLVVFTTDHGHLFGQHGLNYKGPFHYEDLLRVPFVVRQPGTVTAGRRSSALQSHVDLAPTFLDAAHLDIPREMTGVSELPVWTGALESVRDHVISENRHEPTSVNLQTYIDDRYKLTVYYRQTYGELFDLQEDPGETHNLWSDPAYLDLKAELLLRYAWADLGRDPLWMPRVAAS